MATTTRVELNRVLGMLAQTALNETALFSDEDLGSGTMRSARESRRGYHKLGSLPSGGWAERALIDTLAQVQFMRKDGELHLGWLSRLERMLANWTEGDTESLIEHQARRMGSPDPAAVARQYAQRRGMLDEGTYLRALMTTEEIMGVEKPEITEAGAWSVSSDDEIDKKVVMTAAWPLDAAKRAMAAAWPLDAAKKRAPEEFTDEDAHALLTEGVWGA